ARPGRKGRAERGTRLRVETDRAADAPGDPVDHHVRQQLIFGEAALDVATAVAPGSELLDDPCREARRRVVERVGEGLGPGALDVLIASLGLNPFAKFGDEGLLGMGQRWSAVARLGPGSN